MNDISNKTIAISENLLLKKSLWGDHLIITAPHHLFPICNVRINDQKVSQLVVSDKCLAFSHREADYVAAVREGSPDMLFLYRVTPKGLKLITKLPTPGKLNLALEAFIPGKGLLVCSDRERGIVITIDVLKRKVISQVQVQKINKIYRIPYTHYILCHTGKECGDLIQGAPQIEGNQQLHVYSLDGSNKLVEKFIIPIKCDLVDFKFDRTTKELLIYSIRRKYHSSLEYFTQCRPVGEEEYLELWKFNKTQAMKISTECY